MAPSSQSLTLAEGIRNLNSYNPISSNSHCFHIYQLGSQIPCVLTGTVAAVLVRGSCICLGGAKLSLVLGRYVPRDFSGHHVLLMQ